MRLPRQIAEESRHELQKYDHLHRSASACVCVCVLFCDVCVCVCVCVCIRVCLLACLLASLLPSFLACRPACQPACLPACLPTSLPACLRAYLLAFLVSSFALFLRLSALSSVCLFVLRLFVRSSFVCSTVRLNVCSFVRLCTAWSVRSVFCLYGPTRSLYCEGMQSR